MTRPEKLILEKGRAAATPFTTPVQILFKASKVLQGSKKNKEVENDLLSIMAPPASPELNPLYESLRKIYDLSQILKENGPMID